MPSAAPPLNSLLHPRQLLGPCRSWSVSIGMSQFRRQITRHALWSSCFRHAIQWAGAEEGGCLILCCVLVSLALQLLSPRCVGHEAQQRQRQQRGQRAHLQQRQHPATSENLATALHRQTYPPCAVSTSDHARLGHLSMHEPGLGTVHQPFGIYQGGMTVSRKSKA